MRNSLIYLWHSVMCCGTQKQNKTNQKKKKKTLGVIFIVAGAFDLWCFFVTWVIFFHYHLPEHSIESFALIIAFNILFLVVFSFTCMLI